MRAVNRQPWFPRGRLVETADKMLARKHLLVHERTMLEYEHLNTAEHGNVAIVSRMACANNLCGVVVGCSLCVRVTMCVCVWQCVCDTVVCGPQTLGRERTRWNE